MMLNNTEIGETDSNLDLIVYSTSIQVSFCGYLSHVNITESQNSYSRKGPLETAQFNDCAENWDIVHFAQGYVHIFSLYVQSWRLHKFSRQYVLVFDHPCKKKI